MIWCERDCMMGYLCCVWCCWWIIVINNRCSRVWYMILIYPALEDKTHPIEHELSWHSPDYDEPLARWRRRLILYWCHSCWQRMRPRNIICWYWLIYWLMVLILIIIDIGYWLKLVVDYWLMFVVDYWLSVVDCWLMSVVDYWLM